MNTSSKVTFYNVKTNAAKLQMICSLVSDAFQSQQKLLIAVPSPEAAAYIDQLLWRMPEDSFIPHLISEQPTPEPITIAVNPTQNLNQAKILLNLLPSASTLADQFTTIYELFDETDPTKALQSLQRQEKYRQVTTVIFSPQRED